MRNTILKIGIYTALILGLHLYAAWQAGGYFDAFYLRFTNGQHPAMILGSSRAAQGLLPAVLNSKLEGYASISNFAFTLANSPYGKTYLDAIRKKLDTVPTSDKKQLFILEVNPWSLSIIQNSQESEFRETNLVLAKVNNVDHDGRPNFEYLLKSYPAAWGKIVFDPFQKKELMLHEDGWLEVNIPMDSIAVADRTAAKIADYQKQVAPNYEPSPIRLAYLQHTISLLQEYGEVVLLRMPVSPPMQDIEQAYYPEFDDTICTLANDLKISYWNLASTAGDYQYTDGNHLGASSGKQFSAQIADWILKQEPSRCE